MTNLQARLIASALIVIAGAVLMLTRSETVGVAVALLGFILFVVGYVRSQFRPAGGPKPEADPSSKHRDYLS